MTGYSSQCKGYKLWEIRAKKMFTFRVVTFNETETCVATTDQKNSFRSPIIHENCYRDGGSSLTDTRLQAATQEEGPLSIPAADFSSNNDDEYTVNAAQSLSKNISQAISEQPCRLPCIWKKSNRLGFPSKTPHFAETSQFSYNIPLAYVEATSPELIDFRAPAVKEKEDSLCENKTSRFVKRLPGMHVIPC